MLEGKAKELFEEWFQISDSKITIEKSIFGENEPSNEIRQFITERYAVNDFYKMSPSMQWGVYQDFADSLNISLEINQIGGFRCFKLNVNGAFIGNKLGQNHTYREEARIGAIEKLNELINN